MKVVIIAIAIATALALQAAAESDYSIVTYYSSVKLSEKSSGFFLHSHSINWGSGSQQQSITAFPNKDDPNSLWTIRQAYGSEFPQPGSGVRCGDKIRLSHATTKKNLHSHLHTSPLANKQEVSGFGDENSGDTGDNWIVKCDGKFWRRDGEVTFTHVDTNKQLFTAKDYQFNERNCRGCPIQGQLEVSASPQGSKWHTPLGIFFPFEDKEAGDPEFTTRKKNNKRQTDDDDDEDDDRW